MASKRDVAVEQRADPHPVAIPAQARTGYGRISPGTAGDLATQALLLQQALGNRVVCQLEGLGTKPRQRLDRVATADRTGPAPGLPGDEVVGRVLERLRGMSNPATAAPAQRRVRRGEQKAGPVRDEVERGATTPRLGGGPSDQRARTSTTPVFGANLVGATLKHVRAHSDDRSARRERSLDGKAVMDGNEVSVGLTHDKPATPDGDHVLTSGPPDVRHSRYRPGQEKVQRKETERQRRNRVTLWTQQLVIAVPGLPLADATAISEAVITAGQLSVIDAQNVARLVPQGWLAAQVVTLVRRFRGAPGQLTFSEWVTVASLPPFVGLSGDVATFARTANGWAHADLVTLAQGFAAANGGLSAAQWVAIANAHPNLVGHPAEVADVARTANGWAHADLVTLAQAFAAANGGLSAAQWVAIANAHPNLVGHPAEVADVARTANGWAAARLVGLATLFAIDDGGRTSAEWSALANAQAVLVDHDDAVAELARGGWATGDVTQVATGAVAAAPGGGAALIALWSAAGGAVATRSMIGGGWAGGHLGTFLGTLLQRGVLTATIVAFLTEPNMVPATRNMATHHWLPAQLGEFVIGAVGRAVPLAALQALMATPNYPASSRALIQGNWTAERVGEFSGQATVATAAGGDVHSIISTPNMARELRAMTTAGWAHADLGDFTATVHLGGVPDADLQALMRVNQFAGASFAMSGTVGHWPPRDFGEFVVGGLGSGLSRPWLTRMIAEAGFGAASRLWVAPGWTAREVGEIVGRARREGFAPTPLVAFLNTANAPASAFALQATWGAAEVGRTVGYCRTRAGAPTDNEMEQLLSLAGTPIAGAQIQPLSVRTAALGLQCGPPTWAQVILHVPTFQAHYQGTRVNGNGPAVTWNGWYAPPAYRVRLRIVGDRIDHVEGGHTFEYFLFTFANCTRAGVGYGGNCTFLPVGTNVLARLQAHQGNLAVQQLAENAAANALPGDLGGRPTQAIVGADTVACASHPPGPGHNPWSNAIISQCYPNAGTQIVGRDLVAIGRYFGYIP